MIAMPCQAAPSVSGILGACDAPTSALGERSVTTPSPGGTVLKVGCEVASGGEAKVYEVVGAPDRLLKLYDPATAEVQRERAEKLCVMVAYKELARHRRLAWPDSLARDRQGNVRGFFMKRVKGIPLTPLTALSLRQKKLPGWTQLHTCRVVHDIAFGLKTLEAAGVFPGDISWNNFLLDPASGETSFIDCDSSQISKDGRHFLCPVYTPEFQPPEVLRLGVRRAAIGPKQVSFSAAILFFSIFTAGGHPYQVLGGASPEENILSGRHFLGGHGKATGMTTPAIFGRYCALSPWVMKLFKRTFMEGHQDPLLRPDMAEWASAILDFADRIDSANAA